MRLQSLLAPRLLIASLAALVAPVTAERILQTNSLNLCQESLGFSAKLFNLVFFPDNNTATVNIDAVSSVEGSVRFDVQIIVYGFELLRTIVNPCDLSLAGLCPMTAGEIPLEFSLPIPEGAGDTVPGIAYVVPDLDAVARIYLNNTDTGEALACVEADISNGKTVDLLGVKWATAIIAGLALLCAAFMSGLGHLTTAAHIAANALALFSYFQAQAIIGLTAVPLPPLVKSWTQDFQWSMGIIHVGFMQDIFRWYQRATGGTAARLLDSLGDVSVQVEKRKRSLDYIADASVSLFRRAASMAPSIMRRGNIQTETGGYIVYGIQRVAFRASIETTNLFMTGLTFFILFVVLTSLAVAGFRGFLEVAAKKKWIKGEKFVDFRNGWLTVLKGILFRITLIGFPQMTILCLWEWTQNDSPAEMVLSVFFFFGMVATLGWAAWKVVRIARRSIALHRTPAYILFSDPQTLNKWGFLYVQFRASAYYFIIPLLGYTFVKGAIVAFGQHNGTAQAICFIIVEAAALITASVLRPWMDKTTNSFNLGICVVNFLNAICLLIFTNVFSAPGLVVGIVGVVLVLLNVIMSLVLLIMLIVKTTLVFFRKNPDAKYQFMADDRASFMKSTTQLDTTTELDALAATARGEKAGYNNGGHVDLDDGDSIHSVDSGHTNNLAANVALPPSTAGSVTPSSRSITQGPVGASTSSASMLPAPGPYGAYQPDNQRPRSPAGLQQGYPASLRGPPGARPASPFGANYPRPNTPQSNPNRAQNNASPWQRGAGYD